jgi:DNA-binding transcriptional ArsR family regulator
MDPRADTSATDEPADVTVAVIVGAAAAQVRRNLGPVAWCALEVLATAPTTDGGDAWVASSSVRTLAARIGVAKNTAHRALTTLRKAGIVASIQHRDSNGEFGSCAHRLNVAADVLRRQPRTLHAAGNQSVTSRRVPPKPPVAAMVSAEFGQQLVLLPSP